MNRDYREKLYGFYNDLRRYFYNNPYPSGVKLLEEFESIFINRPILIIDRNKLLEKLDVAEYEEKIDDKPVCYKYRTGLMVEKRFSKAMIESAGIFDKDTIKRMLKEAFVDEIAAVGLEDIRNSFFFK